MTSTGIDQDNGHVNATKNTLPCHFILKSVLLRGNHRITSYQQTHQHRCRQEPRSDPIPRRNRRHRHPTRTGTRPRPRIRIPHARPRPLDITDPAHCLGDKIALHNLQDGHLLPDTQTPVVGAGRPFEPAVVAAAARGARFHGGGGGRGDVGEER